MSVATSDFEEGDFCFSIRELEIIKLRFGRVNRAIFMIFGLPANARRMALLSHNVAREIITLNLNDKRIRASDISTIADRLDLDDGEVFDVLCSFCYYGDQWFESGRAK